MNTTTSELRASAARDDARGRPAPESPASVRAELVRKGVERLIAQALEVEAELHTARHKDERDAEGKRLVVRNGYLPVREITCGVGAIRVRQPRIHDGRRDAHGRRLRHASQILPAYARHADCIARPSELALFSGIRDGDQSAALAQVLNGILDELPPSFLPRLREQWESDRERMQRRPLANGFDAFHADEIPQAPGSAQGLLLLAAEGLGGPEGIELLEVRSAPLRSRNAWLALLDDLARRGLSIRREAVRSAPEAFLAALSDLNGRRDR